MTRFNHVQHRVKTMAPSYTALPAHVTLNLFTPVPVPLPQKASGVSKPEPNSMETSPAAPGSGQSENVANGVAADGEPAAVGGGAKENSKKKDKNGVSANGKASSTVASGEEKATGGGNAGASDSTPAASAAEGDPSKLDVRVGVIVKAWEHPDSEKLFCEEIDLGEVGGWMGKSKKRLWLLGYTNHGGHCGCFLV